MSNEAASLLEQLAVLDVEIEARVLMRAMILGGIIRYIEARKTACGYVAESPVAGKWEELEKSVSVGSLVGIVDFLVESRKTIPEFIEAWQLHGDIRLALRVLARSSSVSARRFDPTCN